MLRIGVVANEVSGDLLGAALIRAIKAVRPDSRFEGVGGPRMLAEGCISLVPMEHLSVMGLVEVLKHLPELLRIRRQIRDHFLTNPPAVFVGVDAPDFNLDLEQQLRRSGIKTVHYVSPTVWAWRSNRVRKIRRAADLVLSLFPFEVPFLQEKEVPVRYIGHPLAQEIPLQPDQSAARQHLGLPAESPIMALLPGSRMSEAHLLSETFINTAAWCLKRRPEMRFVTPLVNARVRAEFEQALTRSAPDLPIDLIDGNSQDVITAADIVLTASGTATLETLLCKRPMVVAYRLNPLSLWLVQTFKLVKVPYMAMANILADEELAPEFLQEACRPESLGQALLALADNQDQLAKIKRIYTEIHQQLRRDSGKEAAEAVLALVGSD